MQGRVARMIAAWLAAVWLFAGCATSNAVSVESLRVKAAAEKAATPAREVALPGFMGEPRRADPALANASLDQAAAAIAPLRDAPDSPPPAPPSAVVLRARSQASRGDMEGAVRTLAEHVRQSGNDLQAWRELARLLDASGRRDLANDAWLRLLLSLPTDAEALGAGGIDAASARQPLVAAERLLRLRQMERLGEAPQPDPGAAIARTVALGLSLREIGYLRAAAICLQEAAGESAKAIGPEAASILRQAGDLQRIAGECLMQAGMLDEAVACFREALAATGPEDRVALPRLVWCLASQGRVNGAALALAEALQRADAPGRSGVSQAASVLALSDQRELAERVLAASCDASTERARLLIGQVDRSPCGDTPVQRLLQDGARPSLAVAMASIAERQGLSAAIDQAWVWTAAHPWQAADMAHALRCLPSPASLVRAALAPRMVDAPVPASMQLATAPGVPASFDARAVARLLAAQFELQGGEVERAFELCDGAPADAEPLRAVAVSAATFMEDGARVRALAAQPVVAAPLAAALAEAFAAFGEAALADTWAERAIALDDHSAVVWVARSRADMAAAGIDPRDQASRTAVAAARLSAERAWEAQPSRYEGARHMLELAPADRVEQGELRQLLRQSPVSEVSLRELDRAEALRRAQQGQGDPVLESLRALVTEDPVDTETAVALVTAGAAAGQLAATEAWLDALRARRPGSPALLEAMVSVKARQGRLLEGVQALRQASQDEPESRVRRRAWARGLSVAGRNEEAWSVVAPEATFDAGPRAALERAEFALRANRTEIARDLLARLATVPSLTEAQRLTALSLALRLPRDMPDRLPLLATLGRSAMDAREAGPAALSAAMLAGSMEEAIALANAKAQAWTAVATIESAQRLLDEGMPRRAAALLAATDARADRAERRGLRRAQIAILAQIDDASTARTLLQDTLRQGIQPFLSDATTSTEAIEMNELAGAFLLAEHAASAEQLFEASLAIDPALRDPLNNLAWLRLSRGTIDDTTRDLVKRALIAGPDDPSTLDTAGWSHYLDGARDPQAQQAVELLQRATSTREPSLESLDHSGDAFWRAGKREQATRAWRQVAESVAGRGARNRVMEAFDRMQQRLWGVRAWSAASFYDARDGAAIERAQAKLKAVAQGVEPPVAERLTQPPTPAAPADTVPATPTSPTSPSTP